MTFLNARKRTPRKEKDEKKEKDKEAPGLRLPSMGWLADVSIPETGQTKGASLEVEK